MFQVLKFTPGYLCLVKDYIVMNRFLIKIKNDLETPHMYLEYAMDTILLLDENGFISF